MVSDKGGRGVEGCGVSVNPVAPSAKSRGRKNTFYMKLFIPARGSKIFAQRHCILKM